ncbi:hypothetical protein ACFSQ7_13395 [Paenibacillus rhizoplanae]
MDGFYPVLAFLRVRNKPQILELMQRNAVQNLLVNQSDDSDLALPVTLGYEIILFLPPMMNEGDS